jgi:hypothetical protein
VILVKVQFVTGTILIVVGVMSSLIIVLVATLWVLFQFVHPGLLLRVACVRCLVKSSVGVDVVVGSRITSTSLTL